MISDKTLIAQDHSCLECRVPWGINRTLYPTPIIAEDGEEVMLMLCETCFLEADEKDRLKKAQKENTVANFGG